MILQAILTWVGETPIDCLLIVLFGSLWFIIYYIHQYRHWGLLSLGTWIIGFDFYLKIIFMYPFGRSPENMIAVANRLPVILNYLDWALRISAIGVISMLIGALGIAPYVTLGRRSLGLDHLHDVLLNGWCTRRGMITAFCLAVGVVVLLFGSGFQPFVARSLVFERPELRPIYNLWGQLIPFCALAIAARGIAKSSPLIVGAGIMIALNGALGGDRTVVVLTLVEIWIMAAMPVRRRGWLVPLVGAVALASFALAIGGMRSAGQPGVENQAGTLDQMLYGNNFSDLRDFAWTLSGLFDQRFYGLTYAAGFLSFVPTFLLDFRYDMGIGRVTAALAGLDPSKHSGLRLPLFGELYLNFDLPGVIVGGVVFGIILRTILSWVETRIDNQKPDGRSASVVAVWTGFIAYGCLTSVVFTPGFAGLYVLAGLIGLGAILRYYEGRYIAHSLKMLDRSRYS